jgi:hypothetical protein
MYYSFCVTIVNVGDLLSYRLAGASGGQRQKRGSPIAGATGGRLMIAAVVSVDSGFVLDAPKLVPISGIGRGLE